MAKLQHTQGPPAGCGHRGGGGRLAQREATSGPTARGRLATPTGHARLLHSGIAAVLQP